VFGARFSLVDDLLGLLAGTGDNPLCLFLRVGDREVGRLLSEGQDVSRRIHVLQALPPATAAPEHLSPSDQAQWPRHRMRRRTAMIANHFIIAKDFARSGDLASPDDGKDSTDINLPLAGRRENLSIDRVAPAESAPFPPLVKR
jgi:hypothetical protein